MAARDPNESPPGAGPEFLDEASEHFRQLRRQAEWTAEAVRSAAAVAGGSADDSLVSDLAGTLAERGEEIATECRRLSAIVERARAAAAPADAPAHAPRPVADSGGRAQGEEPDAAVSEGVRLLITQMAVAGADRAEIEQRLAEDFGISDPAPVLRELFGPAAG